MDFNLTIDLNFAKFVETFIPTNEDRPRFGPIKCEKQKIS